MKTPFTSKGDMVSELQTAQHYIQTLGHHSYDIGFTEGCRFCEKVIYDRVLEIISYVRQDVNNGYMFDMVDEIEKRVKSLRGEKT